jgi:alpha-L-rhamnosidase
MPTSPGYRTFDVTPRPGGGLTHVTQRLDSPYGRIEIDWHIEADQFRLAIAVPDGSEATVEMPSGRRTVVGVGRHEWSCEVDA